MHACKLDGCYSDTWLLLLYSSPVSQCCLYFQTVAILKAINTQETPVKEKHLRSILLHSGLVSLYLKVLHKVHLTTNVWTIHPKSKRYTLCMPCPIFWSVFYYEYSKTLLIRPLFVLSKSRISGVVLPVNLLLNGLHSLQNLYSKCSFMITVKCQILWSAALKKNRILYYGNLREFWWKHVLIELIMGTSWENLTK